MRKKNEIIEEQIELETPISTVSADETAVLDTQNLDLGEIEENIVVEEGAEESTETLDMTPLTDWEKFDALERELEEEKSLIEIKTNPTLPTRAIGLALPKDKNLTYAVKEFIKLIGKEE